MRRAVTLLTVFGGAGLAVWWVRRGDRRRRGIAVAVSALVLAVYPPAATVAAHVVTAPVTAVAAGAAAVHGGGDCDWHDQQIVVCAVRDPLLAGTTGDWMIGGVWISDGSRHQDPATAAHERQHLDQWAIGGLSLMAASAVGGLAAAITGLDGWCASSVEVLAGREVECGDAETAAAVVWTPMLAVPLVVAARRRWL